MNESMLASPIGVMELTSWTSVHTGVQRSLSKAEWEQLRPILTHLYVEKNLKLAEIIKVMREEYAFAAT